MKKFIGISLVDVLLSLLALLSVSGAYWIAHNQVHVVRVVSNSMAPQFHRGDLLIVKNIPTKDLEVESIAMLPLMDGSGTYYTHRVVNIDKDQLGRAVVETKGDANGVKDDWSLTITSKKVPIYMGQLPASKVPFFEVDSKVSLLLFLLLIALLGSLLMPSGISRAPSQSKVFQ